MNNYNFPVELQPIFLADNRQIPNRQAVVRTDTIDTLGIVSNGYGLVKHETVVDAFRQAGKKYHVKERIALTNNGAHLFYQMTFPKVEQEIQKGDIVRMMMIVKNSYNAMNSLQVIFGAFRLACENGMILGTKFMSFNYRHTGNVGGFNDDNMAETLQLKEKFTQYIDIFGKQMPIITAMTKQPIALELSGQLFDKEKVLLPQYLLADAQDKFAGERDYTAWGYYNALTYAITHKMKKESPAMSIQYGMEAWKQADRLVSVS